MAKAKMKVKFEKPPVHVSANGSLSILADDIFHSQAGQDVILLMASIAPGVPSEDVAESKSPQKARE
jgi:hypothetical protein